MHVNMSRARRWKQVSTLKNQCKTSEVGQLRTGVNRKQAAPAPNWSCYQMGRGTSGQGGGRLGLDPCLAPGGYEINTGQDVQECLPGWAKWPILVPLHHGLDILPASMTSWAP